MPAVTLSPAQVLKLWKKVNDRFGLEDDPKKKDPKKKGSDKEKVFTKQNEEVGTGLTALRNVARGGMESEGQVNRFLRVQRKVVRVMKLFCKTLKTLPAEMVQDLKKYRKLVRQLTIVVIEMDPRSPNLGDEGDADLGALTAVDDSRLDQALEDAALDEAEDAGFDEDEGAPPPPPPGPPPAPRQRGVGEFTTRLKFLTPQVQKALQAGTADGDRIRQLLAQINALAGAKDFGKAHALLDQLGPLVDKAVLASPTRKSRVGLAKARLAWDEAKKKVRAQITSLQKAVVAEHADAEGAAGVKRLQEVLGYFNKGLTAALDDLYNAAQPEDEARLTQTAADIAQEYLRFTTESPLVQHVQENPYEVEIGVQAELTPALRLVLAQLEAGVGAGVPS
jgi:hypothetical protein